MIDLHSPSLAYGVSLDKYSAEQEALLRGEILLKTKSYSAWGAGVTTWTYLPLQRSQVWQGLTDYPQWVQYFPNVIRSEVLQNRAADRRVGQSCKRLYQVASKALLFVSAQVEIYLNVVETLNRQIQFRLEKGSFADFSADLHLQDFENGTLLTYAVTATPSIPVPSALIQQGIRLDLPDNLRKMRQVLCNSFNGSL
ncbi:MAG: SRPBCC family protein [Leptolyngbyaceae cyanobacterium bins.59]|nr:SRPBCC family protein [Leptolyngbyaceae cyanobacterium bins.59]